MCVTKHVASPAWLKTFEQVLNTLYNWGIASKNQNRSLCSQNMVAQNMKKYFF